MADDVNHVVLIGRLTRDAELKYTANGSAISKFSVAVNRSRKMGDSWQEEAHFFDVALWGNRAEKLNQYLTKGKQIGVQGELRQNRWEQDGQPRSKVEIHAINIQLLGGGGGGGGAGKAGSSNFSQAGPAASTDSASKSYDTGDEFEDDIPF